MRMEPSQVGLVPFKKAAEHSPAHPPCEESAPQKGPHPSRTGTLISESSLQAARNKLLLFIRCPVYVVLLQQQEETKPALMPSADGHYYHCLKCLPEFLQAVAGTSKSI